MSSADLRTGSPSAQRGTGSVLHVLLHESRSVCTLGWKTWCLDSAVASGTFFGLALRVVWLSAVLQPLLYGFLHSRSKPPGRL